MEGIHWESRGTTETNIPNCLSCGNLPMSLNSYLFFLECLSAHELLPTKLHVINKLHLLSLTTFTRIKKVKHKSRVKHKSTLTQRKFQEHDPSTWYLHWSSNGVTGSSLSSIYKQQWKNFSSSELKIPLSCWYINFYYSQAKEKWIQR